MPPATRVAVSFALTGTHVIPSMAPMVLMGALDFGAPIPSAGGVAAGESSIDPGRALKEDVVVNLARPI